MSTNEGDMKTLLAHVERLKKMVSPTSLPPEEQWSTEFQHSVAEFVSDVEKVKQDLQVVASETTAGKFLNAQERADKISGCVQSVARAMDCFVGRGLISMQFRIERVDVMVEDGFRNIGDQIHGVREDLKKQYIEPGIAIPGLHPTLSALYNDSESGRSECEPDTREEALATIYAWILGPDHPDLSQYPDPVLDVRHERLIMWLYAIAGAGKSTIAMTTAQWCYIRRILAAAFFCGRDGDRSNVLAIMPTIAFQLAHRCPIFRDALREAVVENPNVHQMSVASQLEKLIADPLYTAVQGGSHAFDDSVIIIDALDECTDEEAVSPA
ncbi:hypothetical protein NUW54_g12440 [Trametes sanguinea]|uniref:Uncharacterized protein n=1 Tax=Trametes sanguinea TaxID=158606 RepID=A0ACC1MY81_9APHY|nr:hypothetical protein NUW54_g12440 [Trametes sanguinea]